MRRSLDFLLGVVRTVKYEKYGTLCLYVVNYTELNNQTQL